MSSKRLNSYTGKLGHNQIADGINAARRNARRLLEDAQILLDAHRYPTAAALAILSIEESGKESILRELSIATTDKEVLRIWKDYRSHIKKTEHWLVPQLVMGGARKLEDFRPLFESTAEHPYTLEKFKQISFYTDCLGKVRWSEPSDVLDKDLATMLTKIAKVFVTNGKITAKEIELWVKHLGVVKNRPFIEQKEALLHWYAEMQGLGLAPKGQSLTDILHWLDFNIK